MATRVLVVEDERIVALHAQQQLRTLGYDVPAIVASGDKALEKIAELRPDIVLMDINIEGKLDGIETAARIPDDWYVPVIYVTAYADEATLARARKTKPFGYLVKPFSERELHATIQMVLERGRTEQASREHERSLARLVDERTAELSNALKRLQDEIEEKTRVEQALRQAQKMEAIGQLTGGIAHDFNNLLTVVRGGLELIDRDPGNIARVMRLTGKALTAVERGERLIRQLLMFARRQAMRPETVDVNRLIAEFKTVIDPAIGDEITLSLHLEPNLSPVFVDTTQLQSAILNLVINARDAITGGHGMITIETAGASFDAEEAEQYSELAPGRYVLIAITDNGHGIAPDVLPKVFDPFFTTKEVGSGSGLGLSQVYGFAHESGGRVAIYSEPGKGTTARLYLPEQSARHRVEPTSQQSADTKPLLASGSTVLVVEDDEAVLGVAVESLEEAGWKVLTAPNAVAGLRILQSDTPLSALFCDVVLPGTMNGAQLAVEARRLRPRLSVLLTSGYAKTALAAQGGLDRDVPFLAKPYHPRDLVARLPGPAIGIASAG